MEIPLGAIVDCNLAGAFLISFGFARSTMEMAPEMVGGSSEAGAEGRAAKPTGHAVRNAHIDTVANRLRGLCSKFVEQQRGLRHLIDPEDHQRKCRTGFESAVGIIDV